MVFKKFYINLVIRVLLITLTCLGIGITGFRSNFIFTSVLLFLLLILEVILLIRYLNRINDQLEIFFDYIRNEDPKVTFRDSGNIFNDKSTRNYFTRLSEIIIEFRRREKSWYFLLQHTIEHIGIAIIVVNHQNKISICNQAARDMLGLAMLRDLEDIRSHHPGIAYQLESIKGGQKRTYKFMESGEIDTILIRADEFKLYEENQKLISFQSIRSELQDMEVESWQKLIRVLTHEINNTFSPLNSLTDSIRENLLSVRDETFSNHATAGVIDNSIQGLDLINERTSGMLKFIKQFRSVTLPPRLDASFFSVRPLFSDLEKLFSKELKTNHIEFSYDVNPQDITIFADKKLIEQVLINLVRNAIEAHIENNGKVKFIRSIVRITYDDKISIELSDNAGGISPEILENIFMPLFTTKENGSGVGLSFSRLVIQKHNGTISAGSKPGEGTIFRLTL